MRSLAFFCLAAFCSATSWSQTQERSLIDRLLRPNMELQNDAQGKNFAVNSKVTEGRGTVGTFFLEPKRKEKSFAGTRTIETREYRSQTFQTDATASSSIHRRDAKVPGQLTTSAARDVHDAGDAHLEIAGRGFAGERAFRGHGKSQKSLDRQNPSMTIDQVRELLNKNR